MYTLILICFLVGYLFIALESKTRVDKGGIALITCIICWILLGTTESHEALSAAFSVHLAECSQTILFLLAAMIVVELLDSCGSFRFVAKHMRTRSAKRLLWKTAALTFVLSAVLDNMTTSILMVMILRNIVADKQERVRLACIVILAANAGGAFSPIGDVTTIMLWIGGTMSALGIIKGLLLPSVACVVLPTLLMSTQIHGEVQGTEESPQDHESPLTDRQRQVVLLIGVGGLALTPLFHNLTGLPPFVGVLAVMAVLWVTIELFAYGIRRQGKEPIDVPLLCHRIDLPTILFFLGILLAVGALKETGMLMQAGAWLDSHVGNVYAVDGIIGGISSIIDNVPLVASAMSMYAIDAVDSAGVYCQDGTFWHLLAYCAGTGGSLLIIGSAAGVVVMGIEHITFTWYLRHVTPLALVGYLGGMAIYWLQAVL
ncbi:MAG: sodium:proton antiporter NhaD [Bacteroidaceae bacterium]